MADNISPRRPSIVDEDDIFKHTSDQKPSATSYDSTYSDQLLSRSSSLLTQLRSQRTGNRTTASASRTTGSTSSHRKPHPFTKSASFSANNEPTHDDIIENGESGSGFKHMRKIEVKEFEFAPRPEYEPSSSLEKARSLIRGRRFSAEQENITKDSDALTSRSSRLGGLKPSYSSSFSNDREDGERNATESRFDRLIRQSRSRFETSRNIGDLSSKQNGTAVKRSESEYVSSSRTELLNDASQKRNVIGAMQNGINRTVSEDHSKFNFRDYLPNRDKTLSEDVVKKDVDVDNVSDETVGVITENIPESHNENPVTQTFEKDNNNDVNINCNNNNVVKEFETIDEDSDEPVETSEEVIIVEKDGQYTQVNATVKSDNIMDNMDIYSDMPPLEEDTTWNSNVDGLKNSGVNLLKDPKPDVYSFNTNGSKSTGRKSNSKSLENYEGWTNLEGDKRPEPSPVEKFMSKPIDADFQPQNFKRYEDLNIEDRSQQIKDRIAKIKHDLDLRRELEDESENYLASVLTDAQDLSPNDETVDSLTEIVDGTVKSVPNISNTSYIEPVLNSKTSLTIDTVDYTDTCNNISPKSRSPKRIAPLPPLSPIKTDTPSVGALKRDDSVEETSVEFVKIVTESSVVFTHPKNGEVTFPKPTSPRTSSSSQSPKASSPIRSKELRDFATTFNEKEVMIIPKPKDVVIPTIFKDIKQSGNLSGKKNVKQNGSKPNLPPKPKLNGKSKVIPKSTKKKPECEDGKALLEAIKTVTSENGTAKPTVKPTVTAKPADTAKPTDKKMDNKIRKKSIGSGDSNAMQKTSVNAPVDNSTDKKLSSKAKSETHLNMDSDGSDKKPTKKPSVKSVIKLWERRKSEDKTPVSPTSAKSLGDLTNGEPKTARKSLFKRLSQPKHPVESRSPKASGRKVSALLNKSFSSSATNSGDGLGDFPLQRRSSVSDIHPSNNALLTNDFSDTDSVKSSRSLFSTSTSSSGAQSPKKNDIPGYMRPKKRQKKPTDEYLYGSPSPPMKKHTDKTKKEHVKPAWNKHQVRNTVVSPGPGSDRQRSKSLSSASGGKTPPLVSERKTTKENGLPPSGKTLVTQLVDVDGTTQKFATKNENLSVESDVDTGLSFLTNGVENGHMDNCVIEHINAVKCSS